MAQNSKPQKIGRWNLFKRFFSIGINADKTQPSEQIFPINQTFDKDGNVEFSRDLFPPEVQKYYNYFLAQRNVREQIKDRDKLFEDLNLLYFNCPLISRAMDICAAEVIQADTTMIPITVEAPEDQKDFILDFYNDISLYKHITPTVKDIIKYGNAIWILGMDDNGVTEIIPTEIRQLRDRLEFIPYKIEDELNKNKIYTDYVSIERVKNLIDHIKNNDDDTIQMFKRYLIGFQLHDYILPPWRALHFRNVTTESPFDPFGVPFYIHALAPFKMWDAGQTFKTMARALNFPTEKWTVNLPNIVDHAEKFKRARQFLSNLDNVAFKWQNKEDQTMGQRVVTIKDLLEWDLVRPEIDLKDMEEDSLREELVVATRLPRFIIDPRESGFGEGGSTLVEKWKEFARFVFSIQSIFLENLTQLTKIHMIMSGKWKEDEIDFILSMPFPESKNSELVESQNRLLDFSKSLIDTISEKLFNGQPIPKEVVVSILHQMNIFDQTVVDGWVEILDKNKPSNPIGSENSNVGNDNAFFGECLQFKHKLKRFVENFDDTQKDGWVKLEESVGGKKKLNEKITSIIFKQKQKTFKEGVMKKGHFYSSTNKYADFDASLLRKWDVERVKKLQEVAKKGGNS